MQRPLVPLAQESVRRLRRDSVLAADGPAGQVRDLYFDDRTWKVRHLVVETPGWLAGRRVLLAPGAVDVQASGEGRLRVSLTRAQVAHAPDAESDRPVARQLELAEALRFGYPFYWSGFGLWAAAPGASREEAERAAHAALARGDRHLRSAMALLGCTVRGEGGALGELVDLVVDERAWAIARLVLEVRRPHRTRLELAPVLVERIDWRERRIETRAAPAAAQGLL